MVVRIGRSVGATGFELMHLSILEVMSMPMKNPPHPGEVMRRQYIKLLGLSVTNAAKGIGVSRNTLSIF